MLTGLPGSDTLTSHSQTVTTSRLTSLTSPLRGKQFCSACLFQVRTYIFWVCLQLSVITPLSSDKIKLQTEARDEIILGLKTMSFQLTVAFLIAAAMAAIHLPAFPEGCKTMEFADSQTPNLKE